jgi:hypothetical protein
MWLLFVDAKTWGVRPSELVAIDDEYVAYCLDQAVGYFGRTLEAELEKAGSDAKNEAEAEWKRTKVLSSFLGEEDKPLRGTYADPAAMFK